jgi:D-alanyl-D-alanine carboxypeptidase/D-alanyl-D-alanine carboxypeptidase (penicillin-binding protein 5/6)
MLNYGFANYHGVDLCKENEYEFDVNIVNGFGTDTNPNGEKIPANTVKCVNISAESASLPMNINPEDITRIIELPRFIYAPVKKGDIVGRIVFMYKDKIIGYSILVSCEEIAAEPPKKSIFERIFGLFGFLRE